MFQSYMKQRWFLVSFACACLTIAIACSNDHLANFGENCTVSTDCKSTVCVGGEAGVKKRVPFCSEDCTGKQTGDSCGGGSGKCVDDLTKWCWVPCTSDADCQAINPERGTCGTVAFGGTEVSFKVCVSSAS